MSMVWIIYGLCLIVLAQFGKSKSGKGKLSSVFFRVLLILALSVLSGIGSPSAEDHEGYAFFFRVSSWKDLSFNTIWGERTGIETSYFILCLLAKSFHVNECVFFILIAIIINTAIVSFIYRYNHPILSLMLLFTTGLLIQEQNLLRQFIASSIFLYSLKYLQVGSWKRYLLFIVFAMFFHSSAILMMVFLPLAFVNTKKRLDSVYKIMLFVWLFSILVAIGVVRINLLNIFSVFKFYADYMEANNVIGMQISLIHVIMSNFLVVVALHSAKYYDCIISFVVIVACVILNLALCFPNLQRLYFFFYVIEWVYIAHFTSTKSYDKVDARFLETNVLRPKNLLINLAFYAVLVYCLYLFVTGFVIDENNVLMSKTYKLSSLL